MIKIGFSPIKRGGSQRRFYRFYQGENSYILILFESENEYEKYLKAQSIYKEAGINVPEVIEKKEDELSLVVEDGGDVSLRDVVVNLQKKEMERVYKNLILELIRIQRNVRGYDFPSFNYERVLKDIVYYLKMREIFGDFCFKMDDIFKIIFLYETFSKLYRGKKTVVYRDFQSENVLWNGGNFLFVDFQDSFYGFPYYDLASLLEDPYVEIPSLLKVKLLKFYYSNAQDIVLSDYEEFLGNYKLFSIIRLLQAHSAYIRLGILKELRWFKRFIAVSEKRLYELFEEVFFGKSCGWDHFFW